MELLLEGDEDHLPRPRTRRSCGSRTSPNSTSRPNERSKEAPRAIRARSSSPSTLTSIGETFPPGNVYFLNTQKLARGAQLVRSGDERDHTIWETINNTAAQRPGSFWVVIDEAHRGMSEDKAARAEARTIVQKFIKGSNGDLIRCLLYSASARRRSVSPRCSPRRRARTRPAVTVDPEEVRASGLLKEAITLYHPEREQASDLTLLQDAATLLGRYERGLG